jgi:gamma-glutamyltranspeptidase/glutathione hydrolase
LTIQRSDSFEQAPLKIGAAATANTKGTQTTISIMEMGGNAIDAAIAAGHVMGVVEPLDCGIAASGFMTVHYSATNETKVIDFLGTAPMLAKYQLYAVNDSNGDYTIRVVNQHNQIGHRSIATPGTLRGFEEAHARYGKLPIKELFEPAIKLAENGFSVSYKGALRMARTAHILNTTTACRELYLKENNTAPVEGDWIKNRDYASTLREVQKNGAESFYSGDISNAIIKEIRVNGGFLSDGDLKNYTALWRNPARFNFQGLDVLTPPAPSSGTLMFAGLKSLPSQKNEQDSHELLANAMLKMFSNRRCGFEDPKFNMLENVIESAETTSLCNIDAAGNAACLTYSNNNHSGVVIPRTGILMNNSMALFSPWPNNPNEIFGGKRPISSMMPTLLLRDGKVVMTIGASGSTRVPTSLMQVLYRLNIEGKSLFQAITEPKFHAEAETLRADEDMQHIAKPLAIKMGLKYINSPGRDTSMGVVQVINIGKEGIVTAMGDPRAKAKGMVR